MAAHQRLLKDWAESNHALAASINDFAGAQQLPLLSSTKDGREASGVLRGFLGELYNRICEIWRHRGSPRMRNVVILNAWYSFLAPIRSLTAVAPHGDFLAARMNLYLAQAYASENSLCKKLPQTRGGVAALSEFCDFITALDNALLDCLRRIWGSRRQEEFNWVFAPYEVHHHPDRETHLLEHDRTCAQVLNSEELAALGIKGRRFWEAEPGDAPVYEPFPGASGWQRQLGTEDSPLVWQQLGTDGPIRDSFCYQVVLDEDEQWRTRPLLRRSRQFIFDARRVAQPIIARARRRLAEKVLDNTRLPAELYKPILDEFDVPKGHPYLSHLDLASVYQPFPKSGDKCSACKKRKSTMADRRMKGTCPFDSIKIWNLALRDFHTFHRCPTQKDQYRLCRQGGGCDGHHPRDDWLVEDDEELLSILEDIVRSRCGLDATLDSVGLGPWPNMTVGSLEEEEARSNRFFRLGAPQQDLKDDVETTGGIAGLVNAMLNGKTLVGSWRSAMNRGSATTDPHWALGRVPRDEIKSRLGLKSLEVRAHRAHTLDHRH